MVVESFKNIAADSVCKLFSWSTLPGNLAFSVQNVSECVPVLQSSKCGKDRTRERLQVDL